MQQEQHENYEHKKKTKNFATSRLTHHRPILLNIFSVFTYKLQIGVWQIVKITTFASLCQRQTIHE